MPKMPKMTSTDAEKSAMPDQWYLNPKSQRYARVGGKLHKRLLKESNSVELTTATPFEANMVNMSADIVDENKEELKQVVDDPDMLDDMLRRLLIAKLCPTKKKKKRKKKLKAPPPSESEMSESDSSD
jgi:hypothetical protein